MKVRLPGGTEVPLWWLVATVVVALPSGFLLAWWLGPERVWWFLALLVLMQFACVYELWWRRR